MKMVDFQRTWVTEKERRIGSKRNAQRPSTDGALSLLTANPSIQNVIDRIGKSGGKMGLCRKHRSVPRSAIWLFHWQWRESNGIACSKLSIDLVFLCGFVWIISSGAAKNISIFTFMAQANYLQTLFYESILPSGVVFFIITFSSQAQSSLHPYTALIRTFWDSVTSPPCPSDLYCIVWWPVILSIRNRHENLISSFAISWTLPETISNEPQLQNHPRTLLFDSCCRTHHP